MMKEIFWNYYGYQYTMILDDEWILREKPKPSPPYLTTSDTGILKMETSTRYISSDP